jgi:hypothetical protein
MHRFGMRAGLGIRWALPLVGLMAAPLWAGSVTRVSGDHVNVKADRVPLGQLLRELAAVTPIPSLVIDAKLEQQLVSSYLEGASVTEAVRKTLEESGIQFLLWGGGAEPLGLYVGDLRKANLSPPGSKPSSADLASMTREERRAARDQMRSDRAEAVASEVAEAVPVEDNGAPADSIDAMAAAASAGASASVDIGGTGAQTAGAGGANGAATATPGQPIAGLPPPVRGTANWVGADGQTHTTGYTIQGDTVVYDDPNFVSFKNSPEARAKRMNMDVSTLP